MKWGVVLVALGLGIAGGWKSGVAISQNSFQSEPPQVVVSPLEEVRKEQIFYPPKTLVIPKIGINAFVESVGMDEKGNMDVPKKVENVAWYNLGYKVGEKGSAVMAGHLDDVKGQPAVFWDLSRLEEGDEILVVDEVGKEFKFIVTRKESYPYDQFPIQEVFMSADKPRLNLITCEGRFDQASKNYSHRVVIYSELRT